MELIVLGSSSKGNGYILKSEGEALVIEAGCSLQALKKAMDYRISDIQGCIISHEHGDHAKHAKAYAEAGIKLLAPPSVFERWSILRHNARAIASHTGYIFGNFRVLPFELAHDVPCVGYEIMHPQMGTTIFFTDTYVIKQRFKNVNHWLAEANYADDIVDDNVLNHGLHPSQRQRLMLTHMSIDNTISYLKSNDMSQTRDITLLHLSDGNSDQKRFVAATIAATGIPTQAAEPGMKINFDKSIL